MKRVKRAALIKQLRLTPGYALLILWLLFFGVSIRWIFLASFSSTREIFSNKLLQSGFHFENYIKAWTTNKLSLYFLNSVFYSTVSCLAAVLIASPAAYVLGRKIFRGRALFTKSLLVMMAMPSAMIVFTLYVVLIRMGLVGSVLTLIVMYTSSIIPFTIFFLTGFYSSLPNELGEAATADGCSQARILWQIYTPLAQPGIITVVIFNFLGIWNEYFMSTVFAQKQEIRPLSVGLYQIIQSMIFDGDWAGLFAAVMIVVLPTLLLYLILSDKIVAGVTGGALKG